MERGCIVSFRAGWYKWIWKRQSVPNWESESFLRDLYFFLDTVVLVVACNKIHKKGTRIGQRKIEEGVGFSLRLVVQSSYSRADIKKTTI